MDATHVHLTITHLPVFGLFLGFVALLYGIIRKQSQVKLVALSIIIVATVAALIAFRTGESAEETVKHISGVTHEAIEEHEEAAERAIVFFYGVGLLAVIALFLESRARKRANLVSLLVLCLAALMFYFVAQTAALGGKIRHTEIAGDPLSGHSASAPAQNTHNHAVNEVGAPSLNKGEKWVSDAHTRAKVLQMQRSLSEYEKSGSQHYRVLADSLTGQLNRLIAGCTMEGRAHEELHKWLAPLTENIKYLSNEESPLSASTSAREIATFLDSFDQFFE
jgi:uncharacterized membrane protein